MSRGHSVSHGAALVAIAVLLFYVGVAIWYRVQRWIW